MSDLRLNLVSPMPTTDHWRSAGFSRIVFWEPCVSPHKSAFISAVAERFGPDVTVYCVAHEGVPQARQALGWTDGCAVLHHTVVAPDDALIDALIDEGGQDCLHVFSGIRWFSTLTHALARVKRQRCRFALMLEPRDNAGWKGALRFIQSYLTEAWLRRRVQFVLAIGRHGSPWFRSVGYAADRMFPFAYFLPSPHAVLDDHNARADDAHTPDPDASDYGTGVVHTRGTRRKIEVAYVGRLIQLKGVHHLLRAIATVSPHARLTLIGDGERGDALVREAHELSIDAEFSGVLPIGEVQRRMREFDVLALPSLTKDGWGAVVSEALLAGTAVIASSCTGASILLDDARNGRIVAPGDSEAIAEAISDLERCGLLTPDARVRRMRWAAARLTAQAGASYFEQIVHHRLEGSSRPMEFYR